jgi:competence protein ComEC
MSKKPVNRRYRPLFILKCLAVAIFALAASCARTTTFDDAPSCTFAVADVGQGLSQIATSGGSGLMFDVGDSIGGGPWLAAYQRLGSPMIEAIVVSHSHIDHMGGLSNLPASIDFSGNIITHPNEDTGYIRYRVSPEWRQSVHFTLLSQGDTVPGLDGVRVECLWPPRVIDTTLFIDTRKNRYSMVFLLTCNATTALITSDIDTAAEQALSQTYGFGLKSDLMVIPHHGSAGSANPVFFGFVNPQAAIVSCQKDNPYGFPSQRMLDLVYQMRLELRRTDLEGTVAALSDGYYWEWRY